MAVEITQQLNEVIRHPDFRIICLECPAQAKIHYISQPDVFPGLPQALIWYECHDIHRLVTISHFYTSRLSAATDPVSLKIPHTAFNELDVHDITCLWESIERELMSRTELFNIVAKFVTGKDPQLDPGGAYKKIHDELKARITRLVNLGAEACRPDTTRTRRREIGDELHAIAGVK